MLQGFGSTEVCGIAHEPMPPRPRKRGSVGIPVGGDVRAIDAGGRTCGPGETGELVVRGPLVFDGYLDDPDLTARSFTGEWFRTGDLGHVDEDGYVFITGRLAELINRGGEKISPVEIDRAIEALPGVREAGTFGVPHPTLGEELVAAVVLEPDATLGTAEILAHVRDRLGPRQVPRHVYVVDALPRTDAGKLRRRALPEWVGVDDRSAGNGAGTPAGRDTAGVGARGAVVGRAASRPRRPRRQLLPARRRLDERGRARPSGRRRVRRQSAAPCDVRRHRDAGGHGSRDRAIAFDRRAAAELFQALDVDRERDDGIVRAQPRALRDAALLQVRARPRERQDVRRAAEAADDARPVLARRAFGRRSSRRTRRRSRALSSTRL